MFGQGIRFAVLGSLFALGCAGDPSGGAAPGPSPTSPTPGIPSSEHPPGSVPVSVTPPSTTTGEIATVKQALSEVEHLDEGGFASRYPTPHVTSLGYDPKTAAGLDKI